jgi:hypothetical protein
LTGCEGKGAYVHAKAGEPLKAGEAVEGKPASAELTAEGGYALTGKPRHH